MCPDFPRLPQILRQLNHCRYVTPLEIALLVSSDRAWRSLAALPTIKFISLSRLLSHSFQCVIYSVAHSSISRWLPP